MEHPAAELDLVPLLVRRILAGRGIHDESAVAAFLWPDYERDLHDPYLLTDMVAAVDRIELAARRGEKVAVYGDYDIDGITATAVMCEALSAQGLEPLPYIPDRFEEGYGINQAALASLVAQGITLVISVDCGITSVTEAQWARNHGLDLVITDHHAPPAQLPEAVAVINPKRPGDAYPFAELAGVGVAFKVAQALMRRTGRPAAGQEKWLLDLVAYGTVCDVVSLTDENRAIVQFGLKVMARARRVGLAALADVARVDISQIRSSHLGFMLGPRMNAAGRLEHAKKSLQLVQTTDVALAQAIAVELDGLNLQRRADQQIIVDGALAQAEVQPDAAVLVLADAAWSHGIVGIAASKVAERLHKPVLVGQIMGEITKGSARSVPGFDIVAALRARPELFIKYGGHAFAAGFTVFTERLPELRDHLCAYWAEHTPTGINAKYIAELPVGDFSELNFDTLQALDWLEPYGNGNPEPLFEISQPLIERSLRMGSDGKHLRLALRDGQGRRLAAVAFGFGDEAARVEKLRPKLVGALNKNEYQGTTSIQFQVRDIVYE